MELTRFCDISGVEVPLSKQEQHAQFLLATLEKYHGLDPDTVVKIITQAYDQGVIVGLEKAIRLARIYNEEGLGNDGSDWKLGYEKGRADAARDIQYLLKEI